MEKAFALRGLIYSKFKSMGAFLDALGWSRQRFWKISSGKKEPNLKDLACIADTLGCSVMTLVGIFLPTESTNEDDNRR